VGSHFGDVSSCIQLTWGGPPAYYEMLHGASEAGCCEHGNELSGRVKGGEFLDQLSDC